VVVSLAPTKALFTRRKTKHAFYLGSIGSYGLNLRRKSSNKQDITISVMETIDEPTALQQCIHVAVGDNAADDTGKGSGSDGNV
jgi:hypothetical protein